MTNCESRITFNKNCNIVVHELNFSSNYVYAYVLQLHKTTGITTYTYVRTEEDEEVVFDTDSDGFYTLVTIKVAKSSALEYHYTDGKFYHADLEVTLETLAEMNPKTSGLHIEYEYYFLTCHLRICFVNICLLIFDLASSIECNRKDFDSNLSYKRDLIWAALNVFDYYVLREEYMEAERLLERLMNCNGLCDSHCNATHKLTSSCNCRCS